MGLYCRKWACSVESGSVRIGNRSVLHKVGQYYIKCVCKDMKWSCTVEIGSARFDVGLYYINWGPVLYHVGL